MKKEKDVLFLCQYFYPEYVSSATLPFETALSLINAGYEVDVICGYPKEYSLENRVPIKENHKGINIRRLKYFQLKRSNIIGRLINYSSFTCAVAFRIVQLRKYKVIIVYSNPPILPLIASIARKVFKTRIVFVCYDVYPEIAYATNVLNKDSIIGKIMKGINRVIFKNVDKVVALSNEMKSYLLKARPGLLASKVEIIPNWYEDKGEYLSKSVKNDLFYSIKNYENFVVSYFGNMGTAQDLDTIIDAMRHLKSDGKIHFLFAGHGNKMELLKNIVKKERLQNVTVLDFLHGQDFHDALNISDCFIVSLEKGLTGLAVPSKTYSYMMSGKPMIAIIGKESDIARDLTENNAGFAIENGETRKLVYAIKYLQQSREKRDLMGKNCRKVFLNKYTKEKCTKKYVEMIKDLLED